MADSGDCVGSEPVGADSVALTLSAPSLSELELSYMTRLLE